MKKLLPILFFVLVLCSFASAVIVNTSVTFSPSGTNTTFEPLSSFNCTSLSVNSTSLVVAGGTHTGEYRENALTTAPITSAGQHNALNTTIKNANGNISTITPKLIWNGTTKSVTTTINSAGFTTHIASFVSPIVLATTNINYFWNGTFNLVSGAKMLFYTDNKTQTVESFILDNCSSAQNKTLIMNIYDEDNPTNFLDADLEIDLQYWVNNKANLRNFSYGFTGNHTYSLCLNSSVNVSIDAYIKYKTDNGFTHRYFINNATLSLTPINISLYNFNLTSSPTSTTTTGTSTYPSTNTTQISYYNTTTNTTTTTTITTSYSANTTQTTPITSIESISTLKGTIRHKESYFYYPNVIVYMQKFYPSEGVWRTVQMDKSDDYGSIAFNIREKTNDYRFIMINTNNTILRQTERMEFICTNSLCDLIFLIEILGSNAQQANLQVNYTYNNATRNLTVYWNDLTMLTNSINITVTQDLSHITTICSYSTTSDAGNYTCHIPNQYTGTMTLTVISSASPSVIKFIATIWIETGEFISVVSSAFGAPSKRELSFWSFGIILTFMAAGLASPMIAIIATLFGVIITYFLGISSFVSVAVIIIMGVLVLIIGNKVKA